MAGASDDDMVDVLGDGGQDSPAPRSGHRWRGGKKARSVQRAAVEEPSPDMTETPSTVKQGKQAGPKGKRKLEGEAPTDAAGRATSSKNGKRKLEAEMEAKAAAKSKPSIAKVPSNKKSKANDDPETLKFWDVWLHAPPATMAMETNLACPLPAMWATEQGAKYASDCRSEMDVCRLIGKTILKFDLPPEPDKRAALLHKLSLEVRPTQREVKLNNMEETGQQTWNNDGEPGSRGCFTIKRMLDACSAGEMQAEDHEVLVALQDMIKPDASGLPWKPQPLLRVVCPKQASTVNGNTLSITAFVYIRRLIFFLIAYPPIQKVLSHVSPIASVLPTVSLPPLDPPVFVSHDSFEAGAEPPEYRFSLQGIMKSQEHPGYRRAKEPEGLNLKMKDYQLQTLQWMLDREDLPRGLNSLFWEERQFADGGCFFYAPALGELRLERPSETRGGILSEEMGLGKTIEILALILASKQQQASQQQGQVDGASVDPAEGSATRAQRAAAGGAGEPMETETAAESVWKGKGKGKGKAKGKAAERPAVGVVAKGGTLIVVPVHLVAQWCAEIEKTVGAGPGAKLTFTKYTADDKLHGRCAPHVGCVKECEGEACPGPGRHLEERIKRLAGSADIVVTTYGMLTADHGTFARVAWGRIVLDEMQEIRKSTSELARVCETLPSQCRWMVSGTPLYSSVDDLNGELNFLGVQPFCLSDKVDGFWGLRISQPLRNHAPEALAPIYALLRGVMMRHSKSQTYVDGSSILRLPPSTVRHVPVAGLPAEERVYTFLEAHAVEELCADLPAAGAVDRSVAQTSVKVWLRLLSETCLGPALLTGGAGCAPQLRELDQRLRIVANSHMSALAVPQHLLDPRSDEDASQLEAIPPMTAAQAVRVLMQSRHVTETARHQKNNHMVRHDAEQQGVYDRSRNYAMPELKDQLKEVSGAKEELEGRLQAYKRNVPLLRWKWAVECISSGRYWDFVEAGSPYPWVFMRKLLAHLRLRFRSEEAEAALRDGPVAFEGQVVSDKAKLKSVLERSLPIGIRLQTWRATESWSGEGGESGEGEVAVSRGDVVQAAASTAAGHYALGFAPPAEERDGERRVLVGVALVREVGVESGEEEGGGGSVAEKAVAVLNGDCSSLSSRVRYVVEGRVGAVPARVLEAQGVPRNANLREKLRERVQDFVREGKAAANKLAELDPFLAILRRTLETNPERTAADAVTQSGFQQLYEIEQGAKPTCCVCQVGCGFEEHPTFMRCAHFACHHCLVTWVRYERSKQWPRRSSDDAGATCPLCRKAFRLKDLVRIIPEEKPTDDNAPPPQPPAQGAAPAQDERGAEAEAAGQASRAAGEEVAQRAEEAEEAGAVGWCAAATMERVREMAAEQRAGAAAEVDVEVDRRQLAQFPSLPVWVARSLAALGGGALGARAAEHGGSVALSGKMRRLLSDLAGVVERGEKAVVFSQHKACIAHVSHILSLPQRLPAALQRTKHVKIARGDLQASQEAAVGRFNSDPDVRVFLVHAGQGAAGLTLTKATHVILLEPFFSPGEELQAMNRCHRIGQDKPVTCTLYYRPGTIEQRVLAHRNHQQSGREGDESQENGTDALSVLESDSSNAIRQPDNLRYWLGIEDRPQR